MLTSSGVTGEIARPDNKSMAFMLASSDGVAANGGDHRSIAQCWLSANDGIGDVMVNRLSSSPQLRFNITCVGLILNAPPA